MHKYKQNILINFEVIYGCFDTFEKKTTILSVSGILLTLVKFLNLQLLIPDHKKHTG